ncbi:MAG TPA: PPOX class F420-dependent oxidoreductase [Gaiellaceae bacterium]|nr:PPOX class F420-dependent oxidoreductase [Gaiellaceae bacterium]
MAELTERQRRFLESPFVGVVTTLRPDGSPHSTVVWVDVVDGKAAFNTAIGRVKPANIERDPRISLVVVDPGDPYRWVSVDGRASMTAEGADDHIDRLARRYTGADAYQNRKPGEVRVTVTIDATRVDSRGV